MKSIYIKRYLCLCVKLLFVPFLTHRRGGTNISHTQEGGGDKHFSHWVGTNSFTLKEGQTFYVGGRGAYDDVDEGVDVSKANNLVNKASKLSAGAGIFRGPLGPEILVMEIS